MPHTVAAYLTYGCSRCHIRLQVLRVAIDGPYLRARESVALIFGNMLRKLAGFGVIYDTDPQARARVS